MELMKGLMNMSNGKKKKNTEEKIEYLKRGLRALLNANNDFSKTNDEAYLLTIQAQLRGLVATGGKSMHPLILNLSEELNIPLFIYAPPTRAKDKDLVFSTIVGKTWSLKKIEGCEQFTLKKWLGEEVYFAENPQNLKSRNQIIKDTSNFEGGAHYIDETPHIVDTLQRVSFSDGQNNLTKTLLDIAEAVYCLGNILILEYEKSKILKSNFLSEAAIKDRSLQIEIEKERIKNAHSNPNIGFNFGIDMY